MKKILYIFLFFTFSNLSIANENYQKQIDKLFEKLKTSLDYNNSKKIESKIWDLWTTHPSEESLTNLLADGSFFMSQNKLDSAYDAFSKTI